MDAYRTYDQAGRQIVNCGGYAYAWPHLDEPLKVGDRVMLPGNYVDPNPREALVTELGSDYPGDLAMVLRKLRPTNGVLKLREYQSECLEALRNDWSQEWTLLAVVLPTGMGKTVIMAHGIKGEADQAKRCTAVFVHRDTLIKQTTKKIHSVAPHLTIGVVKAKRNEWQNVDVVIISIQTIARQNRLHRIPADLFGLIVIDECHHAAAPSYLTALSYFGALAPSDSQQHFRPTTRVVGFTATLSRVDKRGLGDVFEKVSYTKDILYGIRHGYLVDPKAKAIVMDELDLDDVTRTAGDFAVGSLGTALANADAPAAMAHQIYRDCSDRQGIVFWPTVAVAQQFTAACQALGMTCETLIGETTDDERELMFKRVEIGETQIISNVMVGTEGLDIPQLSFVGNGRLTTNPGLITQMIGRGLRPWANHDPTSPYPWMRKPKTDCLVLFLSAATRFKLATIADLSETQVAEIREGEGLAEAIDREERESADRERRQLDVSKLRAVDVDLFAASSSAWLRTKRGYWFIPTKDWLVVLYPEDTTGETFMAGRVSLSGYSKAKGHAIGRNMTLDYAKAWAESDAAEIDPSISSRTSSWRKKRNEPASEKQVSFATALGIADAVRMTKVELSDQISIVVASRRLDRFTPPAPAPERTSVGA